MFKDKETIKELLWGMVGYNFEMQTLKFMLWRASTVFQSIKLNFSMGKGQQQKPSLFLLKKNRISIHECIAHK